MIRRSHSTIPPKRNLLQWPLIGSCGSEVRASARQATAGNCGTEIAVRVQSTREIITKRSIASRCRPEALIGLRVPDMCVVYLRLLEMQRKKIY